MKIKPSELRAFVAPNFLYPAFYLAWDWALIAAAIGVSIVAQSWLLYALALVVIGSRQHALFILVHEGVHKHLARSKRLNDFLGNWLAAFPLLFDLQAYRTNHHRHHEHTNSEQDPDWIRKRGRAEWQFPMPKSKIALFIPYFIFIRGPLEWAQIVWAFSGLGRKSTFQNSLERKLLIQKLVFYTLTASALTWTSLWGQALAYWFTPLFFVFPFLQRVRSVAEHFGLDWSTELRSSRDVPCGILEACLFGPHFVNYHLMHHLYPAVPAYRLKALYKHLHQDSQFSAEAHSNPSYWFGPNSVLHDITSPVSTVEPAQIVQSKAS